MISLLAPAALAGLALLAIPIAVHLFKPRRVRQSPFSSLRWLHLTQQRMARRIQWHQVLLFLVRAACLTALVLALARPMLVPAGAQGSRDRIVVVDVSRSMGRRVEGRPRPIETARTIAAESLRGLRSGERGAVLLTGSSTRVLAPWTTDPAATIAALETLEPGPTATRLDTSLDLVKALVDQRRPGAAVDVVFLTDNTSGSWSAGAVQSFLADLPAPGGKQPSVAFRLVDVSLPAPQNGWISAASLRETDAGPVLHMEATCVGERTQSRSVQVAGVKGLESGLSKSVTLVPGRTATVDFSLPPAFTRTGSLARISLTPSDEFPEDDDFYLDLEAAGALRVLFIEPDSPAEEPLRPGFPLRTALKALAESGGAAAEANPTVRTPAAVSPSEIQAADIVILADAPGLTAPQAEALGARVRQGAGLAVFLGPKVDPENYNQHFVQPLKIADSLLPVRLGAVAQTTATPGLAAWGRWNAQHPLAEGLLDPLVGDLPLTRSRGYYRLADEWPASDGEVVARFDDGTPALAARRVGAGRVVLFNATPDDRWCDLPRRKSFVPVIDRLMSFLAPPGRRGTFAAGEPVAMSVSTDLAGGASVSTPSHNVLTPVLDQTETGLVLRLDPPMESGFYTVGPKGTPTAPAAAAASQSSHTFVVQPSREESPVSPMDPETLRSWWSPAALEIVKPSAVSSDASGGDGRRALDPPLLVTAGLLLLLEMFLVHWLCPRMNPALAASPTRRRGFVAPLKAREEAAK